MKFLQSGFGLLLLTIASNALAQKSTVSLKKDQKFKIESITKMQSSAEVMGQTMETNMDNASTTTYVILNAGPSEIEFGQTITKMVFNMQAMGQEMSYDSEKKDNSGPMAEGMGKIVNKETKVTIDPFGKVIKQDKTGDDGSSDIVPMSLFGGGVDPGNITLVNTMVLNKDIQVGASWTDSISNDNGKMKTKTILTYTVKSIQDGIAQLSFTGNATNAGTMEQQGQEMNMSGTNKIDGTLSMNIVTGVILISNSTAVGSSTVEAMGMSIPVTTNITTSSKVVE